MVSALPTTNSVTAPAVPGDRPLPHNNEAEVAVLGCMLLDPAGATDVAARKLNFVGSFYSPANQHIFETLLTLADERPRGNVDVITLTDALEKEGRLAAIGGPAYLSHLVNSVPTAANIEQYVDIVWENAILRRLIHKTTEIAGRCYDPTEDVEELLDSVESEVLSMTGLQEGAAARPVGEMIMDGVNHLDALRLGDESVLGVQTGYEDLDRLITGLRGGEMFVLAARPSIGKTALALNMAANLALRDEPEAVGFFSLEMSAEMLVLRLLCSAARVNLSDIRDGAISTARWQEIMEAAQRLRQAPIYIDATASLDVMALRSRARRMKREFDVKVILIDYLQLMRVSIGKNATRENEVAKMSGAIKGLAKELAIPVVVLAQLNRQAEQTEKPRLGHLRESGAIEQDADVVALLHRDRDPQIQQGGVHEEMEAELIIAKHRNGPTGIVPLTFLPGYMRFESRRRMSDEDVPEI